MSEQTSPVQDILDQTATTEETKTNTNQQSTKKGTTINQPLQGKSLRLEDPEPWPEPVDGPNLIEDIISSIKCYMIMEEGCPEVIAFWALHAHAINAFSHSPRLAITSPEKQCGKTTLLDILTSLCPRALPTANTTPAAIFRSIEYVKPTLLIDEADTFLHKSDDLRGILNSGHRKATAFILRNVGDDHEPRKFSTFTPTAIAMIGELPDTLADRSIPIRLRRRLPHEKVLSFRSNRTHELDEICRKSFRWTRDNVEALSQADPIMPSGIYNRNADNWAPLLAIADQVGGDWPQKIRTIAVDFIKMKEDESSPGIMVLTDIRTIVETQKTDKITTGKLLQELKKIDGRPWAEDERGKELTPNRLASLLKPFGLFTKNIRYKNEKGEEQVLKGFQRDDFVPIWDQFLPQLAPDPSGDPE